MATAMAVESNSNDHLPAEDDLLMSNDDPLVLDHLEHLQTERAEKVAREQAQESEKSSKMPSWTTLHMSLAEKSPLATSEEVCQYVLEELQ